MSAVSRQNDSMVHACHENTNVMKISWSFEGWSSIQQIIWSCGSPSTRWSEKTARVESTCQTTWWWYASELEIFMNRMKGFRNPKISLTVSECFRVDFSLDEHPPAGQSFHTGGHGEESRVHYVGDSERDSLWRPALWDSFHCLSWIAAWCSIPSLCACTSRWALSYYGKGLLTSTSYCTECTNMNAYWR